MALTEKDERLIAEATTLIQGLYQRGRHHIGAALETDDGRIFSAVHLGTNVRNTNVCAEVGALAKAISEGATRVVRIAAVKYFPDEGRVKVVSPCGACRELISDYGDPIVVYSLNNNVRKARLHKLLPAKYDE